MRALLPGVAFRALLFSSLLVAKSLGAARQAFEVSGWMTTTVSSLQDSSSGSTNIRPFTVAIDGSKLFIRCNAGTADKGVAYGEFGTDGTNGFHFAKTLLRANPSSPRGLQNDSTMHIEPSPVPPPASGAIQSVWLVYAGHSELSNRTNSFLKPQGFIRMREQPFDQELQGVLNEHLLLRADWRLDDHEPYLLKTFIDYRDGKFASERYSQSIIPDEFMTGKTNSRMDALSWTNIAGLDIPIHARLTTYFTDTNKPGHPLREYFIHHLVATNIIAVTNRRDFVPKLSSATSVIDHRFVEVRGQPARYLATNGIVLVTAEEAWAEAQRQSEETRRSSQ